MSFWILVDVGQKMGGELLTTDLEFLSSFSGPLSTARELGIVYSDSHWMAPKRKILSSPVGPVKIYLKF